MAVVNLTVLACVLRATTEEGRRLFSRKKVQPREYPGYEYMSVVYFCSNYAQYPWHVKNQER